MHDPTQAATWLIRSKLTPPTAGSVLDRPRLLARLDGAMPARVTLVSAPPGYGKTTLLAQWHERLRAQGAAVAWLSLDEEDDEPSTLLAYLAASLDGCGLALGGLSDLLIEGQRGLSTKAALHAILHALDQHPTRVVLCFEDIHRLRSDRAQALLDQFIERMPASVHLLLTARSRPPLRLASLRARGELATLDASELRFTLAEAQSYFGDEAPAAWIRQLHADSEGWPVALQLARLSLRAAPHAPAPGLVGRSADLADYLAEQVLDGLPDPLRDTLLRTSVLERLTGPLVDCMTGRDDGWAMLERLEHANLFLTAIDSERCWFRYHPLFAAYLRERLGRLAEPGTVRELHRKAAHWFFEAGLLQDAVRHAQAGADPDLLCRVLEESGGWKAALRGGPVLLRAFRDLHPDVVARSPRLRLGQIYLMLQDSRCVDAQHAFDELRRATDDFTSEAGRLCHGDAIVLDLLLRANGDIPVPLDEAAALEIAVRQSEPRDPGLDAIAGEMMAWVLYWAGDFERSLERARSSLQHARATSMRFVEIYCHLVAGLARIEHGQWAEAEAGFAVARTIATELGGPDNDKAAVAQIFAAQIAFARGETATVRDLVLPFLDLLEEGEVWPDLFRIAYQLAVATAAPSERGPLLRRAEALSGRHGLQRVALFAQAAELRRAAAEGDRARAAAAAAALATWSACAEDWRVELDVRLAQADHALLEGDAPLARALAVAVEMGLERRAQHVRRIRTRVVIAAADAARQDQEAALASLREAVARAAPLGCVRAFLDHGPRLLPLLVSLRRRASGEDAAFLDALLARFESGDDAHPASGLLSPREREVLQLIADGQTSKEAARHLGVSVNTVMTHRKSLYRKLEATSRARAMAVARSKGFL
jgi:LuxR family transcriptional regulator, maltose regulon positive regulatory protein